MIYYTAHYHDKNRNSISAIFFRSDRLLSEDDQYETLCVEIGHSHITLIGGIEHYKTINAALKAIKKAPVRKPQPSKEKVQEQTSLF